MRTIGLIGGMSWESTQTYYQELNREVRKRLGGVHSASCWLYSFDFAQIEALQAAGEWEQAGELLADVAVKLERAGAEGLLLCTNTMHKLAAHIENAVNIPLLHIADATAQAVKTAGYQHVGLLGTRFTMEEAFYKDRLINDYGLTVSVPDAAGRHIINRVIFDELVQGQVLPESQAAYVEQIHQLAEQGAEAVIFGCTEIGLLLSPAQSPLPVFDTTLIHTLSAVDFMLAEAD
jgi:aspartate racemase